MLKYGNFGFSSSLKGKLGEMRNSPSFQSFGSSVGNTWGSREGEGEGEGEEEEEKEEEEEEETDYRNK